VVLALATLALVVTAVVQHTDAVDAIKETSRLVTAAERAATARQRISSGELVLKFGDKLSDARYQKLTAEIQSHDGKYPLLSRAEGGRGGKFRDIEIEQYISMFEDLGYLVQDNLIVASPLASGDTRSGLEQIGRLRRDGRRRSGTTGVSGETY